MNLEFRTESRIESIIEFTSQIPKRRKGEFQRRIMRIEVGSVNDPFVDQIDQMFDHHRLTAQFHSFVYWNLKKNEEKY